MLLDPRSRPAQLARLASGAVDAELEARWAAAPDLDAGQLLVLGLQARRRGDLVTARARYAACLQHDSRNVAAYVNLANLFFHEGQYERATSGYRAASAIAPDDPVPHYNLAQTYIRTMHYGESDAELRAASEHGMDTATQRRSIWRDDSNPVFDESLTKAEVLQMARAELATYPSGQDVVLQAWKSRAWQSVRPFAAPWLLLALAIWLGLNLRVRTATVLCTGCGTVVCSHCTAQDPVEDLCNTCLLVRARSAPRVPGVERAPAPPRRRVSIAAGRGVAPLFPGGADVAREAPIAATFTVAAACAAILLCTALVDSARWTAGSWFAGIDSDLLRLPLVTVCCLWLPGLMRLRQRDRRLRALARPAYSGA
jgi:hypothetical protein